jgi:integrase
MHDLFGRKEIQRSLHTRDPSVARCLALQAGSRFVDLCDSVVAMGEVSESDINKLIDGFFRTLVANHSVPDPVEPGAYDWDMNQQAAAAEDMQAELAAMAAHRDYSSDIKQEATNLLDAIGTAPADLTKLQWGQLLEGVARARREHLSYILFRQRSLLDPYSPEDPLFAQSNVTPGSHPNVPVTYSPTTHSTKPGSGGSVRERIEQYLDSADAKPNTIAEKRGVLNWFAEFVGNDLDVRDITPDHMVEFRKIVIQLKKNAATDTPLNQARTSVESEQVHPTTAKKKFDTAKTFVRWLLSVGATQTVPGEYLQIKVPKTPKSQKRRPFTPAELNQLFSSPMYTGCKSVAKRYDPGRHVLKDDRYWMPLVLLYTGMRLAEPLQIAAEDVIVDTDHPYFDVDLAKIDLKQDVSDRFVPIHPDLISFGFGEFVRERQKQAPKKRLFRGITSKARVSNYYSKEIGRYLNRVGLSDSRLVAHSFRHGFKDALRNAAVPEGEQKFIMGHSDSQAAHNYGAGSKIDVLWGWVAKLDLGLSAEVKGQLAAQ